MTQVKPQQESVRKAAPVKSSEKVSIETSGTRVQYVHRKMLNRQDTGGVQILHDIPKSQFTRGCCNKMCDCWKCCRCTCCKMCWGCLTDCSCKCGIDEQLEESTYTWVMENRMEFNRPSAVLKPEICALCCCHWEIRDRARVQYFDSSIYDSVQSANPACYNLKTKCCGSKGDKIIFKRPACGCPSTKYCGVVEESMYVTKGEGEKTIKIIMDARDNARARMKA